MQRFAGKVALVTGAASGIGRAAALLLAREGAVVYAADRDAAGSAHVAASGSSNILPAPLDVTDDTAFAALVDQIGTKHGRIDVLLNNAGAPGTVLGIADMDMAEWDATTSVLLRSVALGTRLVAPLMIAGGGGAIVNTASVAAFSAGNAPIAYSVAKAGVLHMTKCAAAELARHRIRVNAVCPGLILTGIFTTSYRDAAPRLAADVDAWMERTAHAAQPVARPGRPEDVAEVMAFLASDAAGFVTGTHVLVDGGLLVGGRQSWDPDYRRPADHPLTIAAAQAAAAGQEAS